MTNDIFKVTFKGAVLKALGKANKQTHQKKMTKINKSNNKNQQLRSEEEHEVGTRVERMGWGRKWAEDNQGWQ